MDRNFTFNLPFRTASGLPARLLGVLNRPAFRYVVAINTLKRGGERVYYYGADGLNSGNEGHNPDFDLVNVQYEHGTVTEATLVHASVQPLPDFPANSNIFHHDFFHMGTSLGQNTGWVVMHRSFNKDFPMDYLILANQTSGQRFRIGFQPISTHKE